MTVDFNYPYQVTAGTPAVANEVQDNLNELLSWIKTNYRQKDDTPKLTQMLELPGTPTQPNHAVPLSYVDGSVLPTGIVLQYAGGPTDTTSAAGESGSVPSGWLICDGSSQSTTGSYAALFNIIGYRFGGSGGNFNLPDYRAKVPVGRSAGTGGYGDVGATGGDADVTLPIHSHTIDHGHADNFATGTTGSTHTHTTGSDSHSHSYSRLNFTGGDVTLGAGVQYVAAISSTTGSYSHSHSVTTTGSSHTHNVTGSVTDHTGTSGNSGLTPVDKNYPPFQVVNYIIKT